MKFVILPLLSFLQVGLLAQNITINLQFDKELKGYFMIRDGNMLTPDTVCIDSFYAKDIVKKVNIERYANSEKVMPLFFELSLQGIANFSGLMICDDVQFVLSQNDEIASIRQVGSSKNAWYYLLIDSLENMLPLLSNKDTLAQAIAINLLTSDTSVEKSEIHALLIAQLLAMDAFNDNIMVKANNYLAKFKNSFWATKALKLLEDKNIESGEKIDSIFLIDMLGNKFHLYDRITKDYLLLDFWASWCGPCVKEMPRMKETYQKNREKLDIISISIDKNKSQWEKSNSKLILPWESVLDNQAIEDKLEYKFNITSIPRFILINKNKELIYNGNEMAKILEIIGQ